MAILDVYPHSPRWHYFVVTRGDWIDVAAFTGEPGDYDNLVRHVGRCTRVASTPKNLLWLTPIIGPQATQPSRRFTGNTIDTITTLPRDRRLITLIVDRYSQSPNPAQRLAAVHSGLCSWAAIKPLADDPDPLVREAVSRIVVAASAA
jgi:hypothetical protein